MIHVLEIDDLINSFWLNLTFSGYRKLENIKGQKISERENIVNSFPQKNQQIYKEIFALASKMGRN